MAAAVKALHYPKAGAIKVGCRMAGSAFNCKATFRRHRIRRFSAEWASSGGYVCAGSKITTCKVLRHGFIPTSQAFPNDQRGTAELAARGYMTFKYQDPQPLVVATCPQTGGPSTWSFCYYLDQSKLNVTIALNHVRTGYITTTTAVPYS